MRTALLSTLAVAALVTFAAPPAVAQSGYPNKEQLRREANRSFSSLDRNRDGWLSPDEASGYGNASVAMMDGDGNGRITREEFVETHRQFSDASPTASTDRAAAGGGMTTTTYGSTSSAGSATTMGSATGGTMGATGGMAAGTDAYGTPRTTGPTSTYGGTTTDGSATPYGATTAPGNTTTMRSGTAGDDRSFRRGGGETGPESLGGSGTTMQPGMQHGSSAMAGASGAPASQFNRMDLNGDGQISRDEFTTGASTAFEMHDLNGDGRISRTEYDRLTRQ